ncbi:thiamine-monophosphate kinase [Alphaproteobacteria bacterium]|nr:thiamine-monophosphate kinase [Alphaproteobacteria bacterium]
MKEYELIASLFKDVKDLFKSDAQIIEINGQKFGITCDNFSLEEDLFTDDNPYLLGCNLVTATVSDLTASGCKPAFFLHSMVLANNADYEWMKNLVAGISDTLKSIDCVLIGGDMGQAGKFSYTGIALGPQVKNVSRIFPNTFQNLYVTGNLGDANEAIVMSHPTPKFEMRSMPKTMLAGIDTSGGFVDALWQLHTLNPQFRIDVKNPPAKDFRMLFGGAGEYELLFSSSELVSDAIMIGTVTPNETGLFLDGVALKNPPPDPRSYTDLSKYMEAVSEMVYGLFG